MRLSTAILFWLSTCSAQTPTATITGIVRDPDGHGVSGASVQARNTATRTLSTTASAASGSYALRLPPGTYELTVPSMGATLAKFQKKGIVLQPAQTLRLEVHLAWGPNLGTLGDDSPASLSALRRSPAAGLAPRTPEGLPDFSGVWIGSADPAPKEPALLPWAAAVVKKRSQLDQLTDNPTALCLPSAVPLAGPGVYKFVQTPGLLVMMFEDTIGYRQVFLDGRSHPKDWSPSWMGHSIASWQADTMLVDTIGFNDRSWLELYPHTEKLHVTERYRRPDLGHLEVSISLEDSGTFSRPWTIKNTWSLAPTEDVLEYVCNENNKSLRHDSAK